MTKLCQLKIVYIILENEVSFNLQTTAQDMKLESLEWSSCWSFLNTSYITINFRGRNVCKEDSFWHWVRSHSKITWHLVLYTKTRCSVKGSKKGNIKFD